MDRKQFLVAAGAISALADASGASAQGVPGGTELVERRADFDEARFGAFAGRPAEIRQLWDNVALKPGVLNNIKNSLNTLQFGFGYDPAKINICAVNHGPSVTYTYSDYVWTKYKLGDFFDVKDAAGNRISTNVWLAHKYADTSTDVEAEAAAMQDTGIGALQARGVTFITCHTAVAEQARNLVKAGNAPGMSPADVMADILTHLIPGALVVPGGVGTLAVLQNKYGFSYATVQ